MLNLQVEQFMTENDRSFQGLILSLLLHGLLVLFLLYWKFPAPPSQPETTEVTILDKTQSQAFVTDTDKGQIEKKLENEAKYLSKFNRRVKKEIVARRSGPTRNVSPQARQGERHIGSSLRGLYPDPNGTTLGQQSAGSQVVIGSSAVAEHIPGVQVGAFTALNTNQFTYYSFFSRVNEQVRYRWVALIRNYVGQLSNSQLKELAQIERVSQVEIVLNQKGEFLKGFVHRSSGDANLDRAAIQGFQAAAPFINPPKGLAEKDGLIHLHYNFFIDFQPRPLSGAGLN